MKSAPLKYGIAAASCLIGLNALISLPTHAAVFAPGSEVAGKTIGEWTADWWQTFLEAPATNNPLITPDTTGEFTTAINDPASSVFFLTGSLLGDPIERSVTVTSKQAILFPLVNFANISDPANPETEEQLRQGLDNVVEAAIADPLTSLFARIDGVEIPNLLDHREISSVFSVTVGEDSLLSSLVSEPVGTVLTPGVADGFWLIAEPLSPGEHTIAFGGVIPSLGSEQNNTYTVTVIPVPEPGAVIGLIAVIGAGLGLRRRFDLADV